MTKKIEKENTDGQSSEEDQALQSIWGIMAKDSAGSMFIPDVPPELPNSGSGLSLSNTIDEKDPPKIFFVHLTTWSDVPILVKYNSKDIFPMAPAEAGGTYLYYSHRVLYVRETVDEINERILLRLQLLQKSWVA
jgi:hypothetical protein